MIKPEEVYKIGKITKPHGVEGEVNMSFYDDVFDRADADYVVIDIDGILVPFFFEQYRFRNDSAAIVKFCDIDTVEQARELAGCDVFFPLELAGGDTGETTLKSLEGFTIIDSGTKQAVGTLESVDDSTINILFNVSLPDGKEMLLPAHEELIEDIDWPNKTITMKIPEGIMD